MEEDGSSQPEDSEDNGGGDFEDGEDDMFGGNQREQLLADLQPELFGGPQNEFLRNPEGEIEEIVSRARKQRTAEEKQAARKKQEIKKSLTTYYESIRCYFLRSVLSSARKVSVINQTYVKSQLFSRLEFCDLRRLLELKQKSPPFGVASRAVLVVLQKYGIRDLPSTDLLFRFMNIHTRRIYMVDLKPFDLKRIELNYFRKRKGKKEVPANENKRDNGSGVLEKIEEDPELDDPPENYMRRKTKQPRSSLMPSECTNSCPSKLSSEPCQELSQQSQRARLSRHALEDEGSKSEWLDLFDSDSRKWRVMSPRSHVIYNEETLKRELNGAATVLLYAVKNLEVKAECEWLFASRNLRKVEVKDVTFRFADNIYYIQQRRHRLGVAAYLAELMRLLAFRGSASLLKPIEHQANAADQRHFEEVNSASFPRNTKEMKMSDLYVTPSLISKFHVLKESAEPFPDLRFREELVFRKADLVHLHSKYGWVDVGRMVREDASAVRVTMTRAEDKELKLYTYSQTEPFRIVIEDGKFLKNEYGSIYINRKAEFPEGTVLVQQPVRYVCKKNGIEHTEVIRGFTRGRPNAIGFLLFKADKDRVLQLYEERVKYLEDKKKQSEQNDLRAIWKKLFKAILISESLEQRYRQ